MNLWDLGRSQTAKILGFSKDLPKGFYDRLRDLGLTAGTLVTCERKPFMGAPIVLKVGDSIFSVDRETAQMITVEMEFL